MITEKTLRRFIRGSAWYDVIVTAPFATPWSMAALTTALVALDQALDLPGDIPTLSVGTMLFANLLGSVVVVWGLARLILPVPRLGRLDVVSRLLFACWQVYAMMNGASLLIIGFTVMEIVWGVLQALPYRPLAARPDLGPGAGAQ